MTDTYVVPQPVISFRCENCRLVNGQSTDEDGYVRCIECGHTVHADVYLGFGGYEEAALAAQDAMYHDGLPEGANCRWCGVEHSAINPQNLER